MRRAIYIIAFLCCAGSMPAQFPGFLQPQAQQLHYNPAFAGSAERPRILGAMNYNHNRLGNSARGAESLRLSVDAPLGRIGGIGIAYVSGTVGNTRTNFTSLCFAPRKRIAEGLYLAGGFRAGLAKEIKEEGSSFSLRYYGDLSVGGLLYSGRGYAGVSVLHPLRPAGQACEAVVQGGYRLYISDGDRHYLSAHGLLIAGPEGLRNTGMLELRLNAILLGGGFAENDFTGSIGLQGNHFKWLLSHKFNTGLLNVPHASITELSLRIYFGKAGQICY